MTWRRRFWGTGRPQPYHQFLISPAGLQDSPQPRSQKVPDADLRVICVLGLEGPSPLPTPFLPFSVGLSWTKPMTDAGGRCLSYPGNF